MKMPLKLLSLWVFILLGYASLAQQKDDDTFRRFGIFAGLNASNMNFNKGVPAPSAPIDAAWKTGVMVGLLLRVPLGEQLFLQPEYAYTMKRGADKSTGTDYSFDYLSMPVMIGYKISTLLDVVAGPEAELLIHAKQRFHDVNTNITHDVEERSIGIIAGADFKLAGSIVISARYIHGVNHIGIGQRFVPREFKYEGATLTAGYRF